MNTYLLFTTLFNNMEDLNVDLEKIIKNDTTKTTFTSDDHEDTDTLVVDEPKVDNNIIFNKCKWFKDYFKKKLGLDSIDDSMLSTYYQNSLKEIYNELHSIHKIILIAGELEVKVKLQESDDRIAYVVIYRAVHVLEMISLLEQMQLDHAKEQEYLFKLSNQLQDKRLIKELQELLTLRNCEYMRRLNNVCLKRTFTKIHPFQIGEIEIKKDAIEWEKGVNEKEDLTKYKDLNSYLDLYSMDLMVSSIGINH